MHDDHDIVSPVRGDLALRDVVLRQSFVLESGTLSLTDVLLATEVVTIDVHGGTLLLERVATSAQLHVTDGDVQAVDCRFRDSATMLITGGQVALTRCEVESAAPVAFAVDLGGQLTLRECVVVTPGDGIRVDGAGRLEVRGTTFEDAENGVELKTTNAAIIQDNSFHGLGTGVAVTGPGGRHEIATNQFDACQVGVEVRATAVPEIVGNRFERQVRSAVETFDTAAPHLEGNLFVDTVGFAIRAYNRSKPHIAFNAFQRNGGRLHMDSTANPLRTAPVEEWQGTGAFEPSVRSMASPPVLVPRAPLTPTYRQQLLSLARTAAVVGLGSYCFWGQFAAAIPVPGMVIVLLVPSILLGTVAAVTWLRRRDTKLLGRGWIAHGQVADTRFGIAAIRFTDHLGNVRQVWHWLPGAQPEQAVDVLYDPTDPTRIVALPSGHVRFGRTPPAPDRRALLPAPALGVADGDLTMDLWDGPRDLATGLVRHRPLMDQIRQMDAPRQSPPCVVGQLHLTAEVLRAGPVSVDLARPFSLTATVWPMSGSDAEVYLQVAGRQGEERVTIGIRTVLSQTRISSEVPLQQRPLPWLNPDDFDRVYARLVHFARVHGDTPPAIALATGS